MRKISALLLLLVIAPLCSAQQTGKGLAKLSPPVQAPEFELIDSDGNQHRMSEYLGQVMIVNFWATWCPPCRAEMPSMQSAWELLEPEGILMFGINVGENEDIIFEFTANYPVEFPLLLDTDSSVIKQWPVRGLPTTFIVDPEGQIVYQAIGGREWDDPALLSMIRSLNR